MPQNFISRYNNLLTIKGLGSIEYTAGPNIDISDYIISGRDWTSDIDSAIAGVKGSGFSAATAWVDSQGYLTAHQNVTNLPYVQNSALDPTLYGLFSGISGSGLYATSAENAFTAETANYAVYSEEAGSAASAATAEYSMSATSAYSAQYAQSANSALGSQTALISMFALSSQSAGLVTEGWDYTDPENSAISGLISGYNGSAFYDLAGDDSNCPWISGNKVIGAITADFGNTYQVISSFDFSGNKNHYISLKGFNLTLPSTANIASALDQKFDTSSFNTFIENGFNPNMTELHGATAYISACCVHNSALESTENGLISSISGSGFYADGGGENTPWISGDKVIDPELLLNFGDAVQMISSFNVSGYKNHAIALKGRQLKLPSTAHIQSALDEKLPISSFSSYTANAYDRMDGIFQLANSAYTTAVNNYYNKADKSAISSWSGDINYISGEFTAYTANADVSEYTAGANIDITNHVVSGKDWLPTIESGLSGKLDSTATANFVTSGDVTGTAQYALTTAGWTEVTGGESTGFELSAGSGISIEDFPEDKKTVISVTGEMGKTYSAGNYIDIDSATNVISVTGVQPAGRYVQYSGPYDERQMASWSVNGTFGNTGELFAINGQGRDELPHILLSGTAAGSKSAYLSITTAGVHIYSGDPWGTAVDVLYGKYNVIGGTNTNVSTANGSAFTVSSKDWTNTITAASAYAASMATGKEYAGVAPIVVNNAEDKISANTMELIAGNGIEFVTAATSTTINCTGGGGSMNVTDGTSSYSALGFYEQVADTGCYQIMGTANDGAAPGHSFGYTLPMQARSFSSDCVDSAKNYTNDEISAHIKYVSYGALAAGTVTFADVRSAIVNGGIVIPYEIKNPGSAYFVYNYSRSGIANNTTGYDFTRYDAGGNCVTLTVSSYNNGATTGCVTGIERVFATPSDIAAVDRIVLVATSGDIPASGATDNKVYIVTGS